MQALTFVLYILLALLILLVMITIHEFGHYIAGKLLKFKINEFSIGFGPKLFSKKSKKTGEVFSLRVIPLGGFCAFEGETPDEESDKKDKPVFDEYKSETENKEESAALKFNDHKPWKRIVVFMAGGVFNILSAVIFSIIFIAAVGLEKPPTVTYLFVDANGLAYCQYDDNGQRVEGFMVNDQIIEVDGKKLTLMYTISDALSSASGDSVEFKVLREGKEIVFSSTAKKIGVNDINKNALKEMYDLEKYDYEEFNGFGFMHSSDRDRGIGTAIKYSVPYTGKMAWLILGSFAKLITGNVPLSQISGPVGTITIMAEASIMNWRNILILLPLIAANLGIFNLMPIPALDGSKIVFGIIEWIRKKPVNRNVEAMIHFVGLIILFGFVIVADITGMFMRCG